MQGMELVVAAMGVSLFILGVVAGIIYMKGSDDDDHYRLG